MRYSVIAARDGDTYHDEVFADNQEEAETKARDQIAEAWGMQEDLKQARDAGEEYVFDADMDGFSVDPDPDPFEIIAKVLADAKGAPTSFEPEQWLEGFEDARQVIAERIALVLSEQNAVGFDKQQFLAACVIDTDEVSEGDPAANCDNCGWIGFESDLNEIKDLTMRVGPGEIMPAGECPRCGCLAHLVESEEKLTDEPVHVPGLNEALAPEWPIPAKGDA